MPAGVPEGVTNAFSALIPAFVILTGAAVIHGICSIGFDTTGIEIIYKVVQTPLQKMTDSLGGAVLMCFTGPFLWFFGVHGSNSSWWNHDRTITGKQPCKSGYY